MKTEEYIYAYTRVQAINDGMLISVDDKIAKEAGFKVPVAITSAVYFRYVYWEKSDNKRQTYQDESGRLKDVLWMCFIYLRTAAKQNQKNHGDGILFPVSVILRKETSKARCPKKVILKVILGPGDNLEPVITIMLPEED